ncbi:MAG: flagellar type III secretion system pore protein FliP [Kofleriaceae bacterium]
MSDGLALAVAALIPLVALSLTSFVKVSVVLSLLRNALGTPEAPSTLVVTSLSLVLTVFVMAPVATRMVAAADLPAPATSPSAPAPASPAGAPASTTPASLPGAPPSAAAAATALLPDDVQARLPAIERGLVPLRGFLRHHAGAAEHATFVGLAHELGTPEATGDELWVLAPAFVTTELKEALAIAVVLLIPFLVLDLVVGLTLSALGLSTTSPQVVALPLKLALLVAVDGWRLLLDGLVRGYA